MIEKVIDIVNEAEKYDLGLYTFNEIMTRIDNSTTIGQLCYFEEYFRKNWNNYTQLQIDFAADYIKTKFDTLKQRAFIKSLTKFENEQ